ncbi:MAG: NAD-dependent epimerase/dehydratase family protein [Lachnospiraceae bacterium]|nr:NAD-dependent epimerase/dehydratase family protein [Lachnospiraceae bacterium]
MKSGQSEKEEQGFSLRSAIVTGPTGAIGIALVSLLVSEGIEVYAVVNPDSSRKDRVPKSDKVHLVECGLGEISYLPEKPGIGTADAFFHLAWAGASGPGRNDIALQKNNTRAALEAVEVAESLGCKVFVGAGSQAEYGRVSEPLRPEMPLRPENAYGIAKMQAEELTRELCRSYGIRHVWPRILSVYGPYDGDRAMIPNLIRTLLRGEKPALTEGVQIWDYLYSEDAAKALYALSLYGKDGQAYPLGSGEKRPLRAYVEMLRDVVSPGAELGFGEIPYGDRQVMFLTADISAITNDTGWKPETGFREGIRKCLEAQKWQ